VYVMRFGQAVKSREQWEKSTARKKLRDRIQRGETITSAEKRGMIRNGIVSLSWFEKMYQLQRRGVLGRGDIIMFQRLSVEDQDNLMRRMSNDEKKLYIKSAKKDIIRKYRPTLK